MTEYLEWSSFFFAVNKSSFCYETSLTYYFLKQLGSLTWFNLIGSGDFLNDQRIIASSIALGLTFINLSIPQEKINKFFFRFNDEDIEDLTYHDALFEFESVKLSLVIERLLILIRQTYGFENPATKEEEKAYILHETQKSNLHLMIIIRQIYN